jgi:CIC family chloride channel protein
VLAKAGEGDIVSRGRSPLHDRSIPPPRGSTVPVQGEAIRTLIAAALIGVCGALAAAAFRWIVAASWDLATQAAAAGLPKTLALIVAPVMGSILSAGLVRRFASEPEGHGVSSMRASLVTSGGFIRGRAAFAKLVACAITTSSGASAGCEGPIARFAAGFGSSLARWLHLDRARLATLTACGAAASIAALFDAPIAGVVFAVEIILGGHAVRSFAPLVVAAATAAAVERAIWGQAHAFESPIVQTASPSDFVVYALLGAACGVVGAAFAHALDAIPRLASRTRLGPNSLAVAGGVLVGACVLWSPGAFGVGYPVLHQAFAGQLTIASLAALLAARFVATAWTVGSGGAGGVFAPSLVMGASAGSLVAHTAASLGLALSSAPSAFSVVGAAATMAATTHAPFTAVVLVYELTGRYAVLAPAALACILSTGVALAIRREPWYDIDSRHRGIQRITSKPGAIALRERTIAPIVRAIRQTVPDTTPVRELMQRRRYLGKGVLVVVASHDGSVAGIVDLDHLDDRVPDDARVADIMTPCPSLQHEATLTDAVALVVRHRVPALPVVDETRRPSGLLWRYDLLDACARELAAAFALPALLQVPTSDSPLAHSDSVAVLPAPSGLVGRTIRQVDVRKRFGVACLGIRRAGDDGTFVPVPLDPSTVVTANDLMIVSGPSDRIDRMRERSGQDDHPSDLGH